MRVGHHEASAPLQTLLSFSNVCFELLTVDLTGNVTSECCMSFMCVFVFACTSSRVVDSCEIKISIQLIGYSVFCLYLTQIKGTSLITCSMCCFRAVLNGGLEL